MILFINCMRSYKNSLFSNLLIMSTKEYLSLKNDSDKSTEKEALLNETKGLLKQIDITEHSETSIASFFDKLNEYKDSDKTELLYDVLQEATITVGNGWEKSFKVLLQDFSDNFEQDGSSWKLKKKTELSEDKQYLEQFMNEKNSSLAYLVQKTANFISFQAARGYGKNADVVNGIVEDKILGNQTKRALDGLKDWILWSNVFSVNETTSEEIMRAYTENDIKKMNVIPKTFVETLFSKNEELAKKFWIKNEDGTFSPVEWRNFKQAWSNNYAIDFWNIVDSEVESEVKPDETKIETYKEEDILKMKNISKDFVIKIKEKNPTLFNEFWLFDGKNFSIKSDKYDWLFKDEEGNFAVKIKNTSDVVDDKESMDQKSKEIEDSTPLRDNIFVNMKSEVKELFKGDTSLFVSGNYYDSSLKKMMKNPFITIRKNITIKKNNNDVAIQIFFPFNLNDYLIDDVFDKTKFKGDVITKLQILEKAKQEESDIQIKEQEKRVEINKNRKNLISSIRKMKYSLEDLYGDDSEKLKKQSYIVFAKRFEGKKIAFHENNYLYIVGDDLQFDFEQQGWDDRNAVNVKIPLKDISDGDDIFNETKFKIALGKKIDEIVSW